MPAIPSSDHTIPTSFRVATSTSPRSNAQEEERLYDSFQSQAASRAISTAAPSSLKVKLEWIERLSLPRVSLATLKESLDYLDSTSWDDLVIERHMEGLCPYPTCGNDASSVYQEGEEDGPGEKKFKLRGGALYDAGPTRAGKDKGPYCSVRCRNRSEWVKGVLGKEGRKDLLEDVEKKREQVKASTAQLVQEQEQQRQGQGGKESNATEGDRETFKTDLLSSLTIHERSPTSSTTNPPLPPTLESASMDFERPHPNLSTPNSSRFPLDPGSASSSSTIKSLHNASSALLPFTTTSLGRTILSSSSSSPSSRRSVSSSASSSRSLPVPASRQPRTGINGLPPVKFLNEPRMIDSKGREIEWVDEEEELGQEEAELVRGLMEEAIEVRRLVEKGEL